MKAEEKTFCREISRLTIPIVAQYLMDASLSSVDVIMLNFVGQSAISAASLASQYSNILIMVLFGLGTGATMLCAQYFGKSDMKAVQAVEGIALRFSLCAAMFFAAAALLVPEWMMRVFTDDAELIRLGAGNLRVMSIPYLCWGITEIYLSVLRSIGRVNISMFLNVLACALNIIFDAVFVLGLFGAPKLGIVGVAVATAIARAVELAGCVIVSIRSRDVKIHLRGIFARHPALMSDFLRLCVPAFADDVAWSLSFSMYSVILGHMGSDVVAANSIAVVVRSYGTTLCFAVAEAGGILLGRELGANQMERARADAARLIEVTLIATVIGGLAVLAASPFVPRIAAISATAKRYLRYMMWITSYYIVLAGVNTTLIVGVFRAGGDTRFGLFCDLIPMWCYTIPVGFLAAFVLKLPVMVVYFLLFTDELVKMPFVFRRYRSGRWLRNITREDL